MHLRITPAIMLRGAAAYTLHSPHAGIVTIQPAGKPRRPAVFRTDLDAEEFRDVYPAHILDLGLEEPDVNAAVMTIRTSRPVLTDASVFDSDQELYSVEVIGGSDKTEQGD